MSVTWFELPPPAELGDGWSLRFLTAAQMLECRGEGEAMAREERDKALWANASLLSRVLLKEGEPAFPSGEAVLASLTVGQINSLTHRWWAQDDFSGRAAQEGWPVPEEWPTQEGWTTPEEWPAQEGWPVRGGWPLHEASPVRAGWAVHGAWPAPKGPPAWEERLFPGRRAGQEGRTAQRKWANREQGENEKFDMARYLELGGELGEVSQEVVGEMVPTAGASGVAPLWPQTGARAGGRVWPQVWPGMTPATQVPGAVQRIYRQPHADGEMAMPYSGEGAPAEFPVPPSGRPGQEAELSQGEHDLVHVLLPETVQTERALTVEELDRAVERDARRYDGGSSLY